MFCTKCGAQLPENTAFCPSCGTPVGAAASAGVHDVAGTLTPGKKAVGPILLAVAAVIAAVVLLFTVGGRSPKATANKFMDAAFKADGAAYLELVPDAVVRYWMDWEDYTKRELQDELTDELVYWVTEDLDYYYDSWRCSYKVVGTHDLSSRALRDLKEDYWDEDININIKAAKEVEVEVTLRADGGQNTFTYYVPVIKVGSSWYIDIYSLDLYDLWDLLMD